MADIEEHSDYEMRATRILGLFQTLELSLKIYIAAAYKTIEARLDGAIPFHYDYGHVENFPLEKLLNIFSKLNSDKPLQARLNRLRKVRNDVAHVTLIYRHDIVQELFGVDITAHSADLDVTEIELDHCLHLMAKEMEFIIGKYKEIIV